MSVARGLAISFLPLVLCANAPEDAENPAASDTAEIVETVAIPSVDAAVVPAPAMLSVPKLTPIKVEIVEELGSKTSVSGQTFALRLAEPIVIDGVELVPAGTPGMGEVVHAKKSGGMGAAGELVLAARYLDFAGQRIMLRSLKLAELGQSRINTVQAINTAAAATAVPLALVGFFIKGGQVTIAAGTVGEAKTAQDFVPEAEAGMGDQQTVSPQRLDSES